MKNASPVRCLFCFLLALTCLLLFSCAHPTVDSKGESGPAQPPLQDLGNGICRQSPSGLMWQIRESKKFSSRQEADDYVRGLELGGFHDWRLPTRAECLALSQLLLLRKGDCPISFTRGHWVSDNRKPKPGFWDEYPLCGGSDFRWVNEQRGSVRAVRP